MWPTEHDYPVSDIKGMLEEIESGPTRYIGMLESIRITTGVE